MWLCVYTHVYVFMCMKCGEYFGECGDDCGGCGDGGGSGSGGSGGKKKNHYNLY